MNQKGFTLIELVIVIVILAVLAVVAIPQYVNLRDEATLASETGVAAGVRAGLLTYFVDRTRGNFGEPAPGYPADLDSIIVFPTPCSTTDPCFTNVLVQGGVTDQWTKLSATEYRSSANATNVWTYTQTGVTPNLNGSFIKTTD